MLGLLRKLDLSLFTFLTSRIFWLVSCDGVPYLRSRLGLLLL